MEKTENSTPYSPRTGRLKIFFGYAAGVGKTYAMLEAAHQAQKEGVDVVVGYVEPHARPELLVGLRVTDAATADQNGPLGLLDDLRRVGQSGLGGGTALQTPDALLEKALGIVIGLALHVLRHGDADGAGSIA